MTITPHFSREEFACRDGTPYPVEWIGERLVPLCHALERIRIACDHRPLYISSGYRTPAYNRAIGGARHSQHLVGRAADFIVAGLDAYAVQHVVRALLADHALTIRGFGRYPTFTHIDRRDAPRVVTWRGARVAN